jgi:hypothetical protein
MIRDHDLDVPRLPRKKDRRVVHDWSPPSAEPAKVKWPRLFVFDSYVRARLEPILVRREAERAAERSLSRSAQAKLWRAQ